MGIRIIWQRFKSTEPPHPGGCRWCGQLSVDHAQQWVPSVKYHTYVPPTTEQLIARKRAWNKIKGYSK